MPIDLPFAELTGSLAAIITTVSWLPQILKLVRDRVTAGISLTTNVIFLVGNAFWLYYAFSLGAWPMIITSSVTILCFSVIIGYKLRFG